MKLLISIFAAISLLISHCVYAEEKPSVNTVVEPPQAVINFISKVNYASIGWLISKISEFQQQGVNEIHIIFLSSGGDTDAGIAGYNYLTSLPLTINTYNLADTSSAASYIFCAGDRRFAYPQAKFLLHGTQTHFTQSASLEELKTELAQSEQRRHSIIELFSSCMNLNQDKITQILQQGTILSSKMALKNGLIDDIISAYPKITNNYIFTIKAVK